MRMVGILAGIVGALVGATVVRHTFKGGVSAKDLAPQTAAGISIQFPGTPEKLPLDIPPSVRSKVVSMENYQHKTRNFEALLSRVVYVEGVEANAEAALEGALSNVSLLQKMDRAGCEKKP